MWYKTDFGSTDRECLRYLKSYFFVKKCKFGVYTLCNFQFLFFSLAGFLITWAKMNSRN